MSNQPLPNTNETPEQATKRRTYWDGVTGRDTTAMGTPLIASPQPSTTGVIWADWIDGRVVVNVGRNRLAMTPTETDTLMAELKQALTLARQGEVPS